MMYFVYVDCKPDGTPFYIGKGDIRRIRLKTRTNDRHKNVCNKYPDWYRGLALMGSEKDALAKEIELIKKYRDIVVNFTDGGEGISGMKQSPETIAKKVKNLIGKKRPEIVGKNISAGKMGKPCNHKPYMCLDCGLVANNGNMTKHHKSRNHALKVAL